MTAITANPATSASAAPALINFERLMPAVLRPVASGSGFGHSPGGGPAPFRGRRRKDQVTAVFTRRHGDHWPGRAGNRPFQMRRLLLRVHSHHLPCRLAADRNLARLRRRHLGNVDHQDAVLEAGLDLLLLDIAWQLDAPRKAAVRQLAAQVTALLRA